LHSITAAVLQARDKRLLPSREGIKVTDEQ